METETRLVCSNSGAEQPGPWVESITDMGQVSLATIITGAGAGGVAGGGGVAGEGAGQQRPSHDPT